MQCFIEILRYMGHILFFMLSYMLLLVLQDSNSRLRQELYCCFEWMNFNSALTLDCSLQCHFYNFLCRKFTFNSFDLFFCKTVLFDLSSYCLVADTVDLVVELSSFCKNDLLMYSWFAFYVQNHTQCMIPTNIDNKHLIINWQIRTDWQSFHLCSISFGSNLCWPAYSWCNSWLL